MWLIPDLHGRIASRMCVSGCNRSHIQTSYITYQVFASQQTAEPAEAIFVAVILCTCKLACLCIKHASSCIPCDCKSEGNTVWVLVYAASVPAEPFGGHPGPPCLLPAAKGPQDIAAESAPAVQQCLSSSSLPGKSAPGTAACRTQCFMHERQKRLAGCFYAY